MHLLRHSQLEPAKVMAGTKPALVQVACDFNRFHRLASVGQDGANGRSKARLWRWPGAPITGGWPGLDCALRGALLPPRRRRLLGDVVTLFRGELRRARLPALATAEAPKRHRIGVLDAPLAFYRPICTREACNRLGCSFVLVAWRLA